MADKIDGIYSKEFAMEKEEKEAVGKLTESVNLGKE
jgi:hypothetical protein